MRLLLFCFLLCVYTLVKAQVSILSPLNNVSEPCSWNSPSNGFESFTGSLNGIFFANDFYVEQDTQFLANRLKVNVVSPIYTNPDFITAEIGFFDTNMNGVGPGNLISWGTIVASSYTFLGNFDENGNLKVRDFIFDFNSMVFHGDTNGKTFWLALILNNGTFEISEYWETTSNMNSESGVYINNETGWQLFAPNMDNVFELSGSCNTLNIPEVEVSSLTTFPNPVKDILNISYADDKLISAILMNISGQELMKTTARTIDMSSFSTGLYFLQLTDLINGTFLIEKVIKE